MITLEDRAVFTEQLRNRRGRPRVVNGPAERIPRVRVSQEVFDAVCRRALSRGESLNEAIREAVTRYARE